MSFSDSALRRRDLAGLSGLAAAAVAAPAFGRRPAAAIADGRIRLRRDPGSVVSAVDVPLTATPGIARRFGGLRTRPLDTGPFALLGVTWRAGTGRVRARVRRVGAGWTDWLDLPALNDVPDRGSAEGRGTPYATEGVWVGRSDAVQVEVIGSADRPVLTLVDPGHRPEDDAAVVAGRTATARVRRRPLYRSRRDWGANPEWATGEPVLNRTIKQVHLHHTATRNDYTRAEVPGIIRSIYRYHTRTLGWSDVGYNFFVDRFGVIWAGRRRPRRATRGAHTLGFNHASVGIAVIGSFGRRVPNDQIISGVVKVAAWKLGKYGREPRGWTWTVSRGSDRYPRGTRVRLPVIDGHRDTNDTRCPGQQLYLQLPRIRRRTARRIARFAQ